MKQELEKEILEEIGMKEGDKLTYEGTKKLIQLTQSKIISIIDKMIEELKNICKKCNFYQKECKAFQCCQNGAIIKELESLKKEVLKNEINQK